MRLILKSILILSIWAILTSGSEDLTRRIRSNYISHFGANLDSNVSNIDHSHPRYERSNEEFFTKMFGPKSIEGLRDGLTKWLIPLLTPGPTPSGIERMDYITCDACRSGLPIIKSLLGLGLNPLIISVLVSVCQTLDILTPEHCSPLINSFAGPVIHILTNTGEMTADDICGILDSNCVEVNPIYTRWQVIIDANKPDLQTPPLIPDGTPSIKILQFTDLHMDYHYKEETNAHCGNPAGCCWDGVPAEPSHAAGHWGHRECQLPIHGLDEIFRQASTTHPDVKYIFFTGDYIHSALWAYSVEENGLHIKGVLESVRKYFPDTPIYPVVGNHEADVCNLYPPTHLWGQFDLSWLYNIFSDAFPDTIPTDQHHTFKNFGYYSVTPEPGLRLLMLNSNLCYVQNFWIVYYPGDVFFQLDWLSRELLKAEKAGESVHIVGHVSPGHGQCWPPWSHNFNKIVNRFEGIIKGQYYGHSHSDEIFIGFEPETTRPTVISYVAPSGMPDRGRYSYHSYKADAATFELMDYETWVMHVSQANEGGEPIWERIFGMKELYGMNSLRPDEFGLLLDRMIHNMTVLHDYQWQMDKGAKTSGFCTEMDIECRARVLCDIVMADQSDHTHCQRIRDILNELVLNPVPVQEPEENNLDTDVDLKSPNLGHDLKSSVFIPILMSILTKFISYI